MTKYGYTKQVNLGFLEAIDDLIIILKEEGFGVVSQIDIQKRIKDKTGKDIEEYTILGVCNPNYAYEAISLEYEIGLLLPCNIIIYKKSDKVFISTILPSVAMSFIEKNDLKEISKEVEIKLKKAIDKI